MGGGWGLVLEPVGAQLFGLRALFVILIRTGAAGRSANPTLWGRCQIITGGHIDDPTTPVGYPFADHFGSGFSLGNQEEQRMTTSYRPTGLIRLPRRRHVPGVHSLLAQRQGRRLPDRYGKATSSTAGTIPAASPTASCWTMVTCFSEIGGPTLRAPTTSGNWIGTVG